MKDSLGVELQVGQKVVVARRVSRYGRQNMVQGLIVEKQATVTSGLHGQVREEDVVFTVRLFEESWAPERNSAGEYYKQGWRDERVTKYLAGRMAVVG